MIVNGYYRDIVQIQYSTLKNSGNVSHVFLFVQETFFNNNKSFPFSVRVVFPSILSIVVFHLPIFILFFIVLVSFFSNENIIFFDKFYCADFSFSHKMGTEKYMETQFLMKITIYVGQTFPDNIYTNVFFAWAYHKLQGISHFSCLEGVDFMVRGRFNFINQLN